MLDAQLGMVFFGWQIAIFFFVARKPTALLTELQKRLDTVSLYTREMLGIALLGGF